MGLFGKRPTSYDTPLTPEEEEAFRKWAGPRLADTQDYDLRGAWKAIAKTSANGHLPDTYKKPNHPTFSNESQYSAPDQQGGQWGSDGKGGWVFWASPHNVNQSGMGGLQDYFQRREPGNAVIFPLDYRLPKRGR